jgi:hypothetical protein
MISNKISHRGKRTTFSIVKPHRRFQILKQKQCTCQAHIPSELILPEYLHLYAKSVCIPSGANIIEYNASLGKTVACLDKIIIPPVELQMLKIADFATYNFHENNLMFSF